MLELGLMFQIKIIGQKIKTYWIEKTKHLEDRLSDRLHEELTKTFIDKRASVLARGLKQDMEFKTEILENNML
jgi:ATP-dependent RNA helicase SUPV3L1/SUV3